MIMLCLALLAAAFTDRKKKQIQAWREENERRLREEVQKKNDKRGK